MKSKIGLRVLVIAEGASPTGFSRVTTSIFTELYQKLRVQQLTPHPLPFDRPASDPPWSINALPEVSGGKRIQAIAHAVLEFQPHIVWILADIQILREYAYLRTEWDSARKCSVIAYCPVDLVPLPPDLVEPLHSLDFLVAYTEYGRAALCNAFQQVIENESAFVAPPVGVIPHGVDTTVFKPIDRTTARVQLLGKEPDLSSAFIVLNANRNQPRKRIDLTMAGFAKFAVDKPNDVLLHLHMGLRDRGWDLPILAHRLGIEDRMIFTSGSISPPFVDLARLNLIYNAADIGVNTAVTEGWGLCAFEHAATGAPQILPSHSVFKELWDSTGVLVSPCLSLIRPDGLFEEHYVSAEDIASALNRLYLDEEYRTEMGRKAQSNALKSHLSWKSVSEQWEKLFLKFR